MAFQRPTRSGLTFDDHETRNVSHKMDDSMPEPLTITEADVGRIVYVAPEIMPNGPESPVDTDFAIPFGVVIVLNESTGETGYIHLRSFPHEKAPGKSWDDTAFPTERAELFATAADATRAALIKEFRYARKSLEYLEELVRQLPEEMRPASAPCTRMKIPAPDG